MRIRFGLGAVIAITTLCCALMGVWSFAVMPFRNTQRLIERTEALGGSYVTNPSDGPAWQEKMVHYFLDEGAFVELDQLYLSEKAITDRDLRLIGQMRSLSKLELDHTSLNDESAKYLSELNNLGELSIRFTDVSDVGARALVRSAALKKLFLTGCLITPATLEAVPDSSQLELYVRFTTITEAQVKECEDRVSGCQVFAYPVHGAG